MSKTEYRIRMIAGFLAYWVFLIIPAKWLPWRVALWFIGWAGFYVHADGWENLNRRMKHSGLY